MNENQLKVYDESDQTTAQSTPEKDSQQMLDFDLFCKKRIFEIQSSHKVFSNINDQDLANLQQSIQEMEAGCCK